MSLPVYHTQQIQAWEQRWFAQQNSAQGLMQQVAWTIANKFISYINQNSLSIKKIAIWCGNGNNAGDGYYLAAYLEQQGFKVTILSTGLTSSSNMKHAYQYAQQHVKNIQSNFEVNDCFDCHIDALFGIGLNRELDVGWQKIIFEFNQKSGLKISIDLPSGLDANTGCPLPTAVKADITYCVLGLKAGLLTGQAKEYVGKFDLISIIPPDAELKISAFLTPSRIHLPKRQAFGHKGTYGHVLVIGGHAHFGGAVVMAAQAAFYAGAGKVTVLCNGLHHSAMLARSPNVMIQNIEQLSTEQILDLLKQVNAVCFGMGLGRDEWAAQIFKRWYPLLTNQTDLICVFDADALWFLANEEIQLASNVYLTPHSGEAARLLNCKVAEIEQDRISAIQKLKRQYAGNWVLKGSGSLILENNELSICATGNAGMATGGMGDVLAGMIASLKAQFHNQVALSDIVTLHGQAGDLLAMQGQAGIQAHDMPEAIYKVINGSEA